MTTFSQQNKGPSSAELQKYIREKKDVEFLLANGDKVVGKIRWFDEQAFSILRENEQPFTILRAAVIGYRLTRTEGK